MKYLLLVGLATVAALDVTTIPGLNHDTWWGSGDAPSCEDTRIVPFKIEWKEDEINDLVYRLKNRRDFVPSLDGSAYNYGVNTKTIGFWLDYWANDYNFKEREAYLNQFPQFKTMIQGLWIHFIRIVPEVPEGKYSIPLLMMHGYPGSVAELYGSINYITRSAEDRDFMVELIIPSLPGFGYSDYTNRTGLGAADMAFIFKNLMHRLGHEKFYIQGGDWGSHIGSNMATFFPQVVLGYHTNMCVALTNKALSMVAAASVYPASLMPENLISRLFPLTDTLKNAIQLFGYLHMQSTEPDTIGIGVSDSPSGLLAYILQQVSTFSRKANINDTRGGLDMYTPDELIDNAMLYWIPNKLPTAFRIYAETFNLRNYYMGYLNIPTTVPTVAVQAANEIFYMPPAALNTKFTNLVRVDVLDDYGHHLAWEAPEVFAKLVLSGLQSIIDFRKEKNMDSDEEKSMQHSDLRKSPSPPKDRHQETKQRQNWKKNNFNDPFTTRRTRF